MNQPKPTLTARSKTPGISKPSNKRKNIRKAPVRKKRTLHVSWWTALLAMLLIVFSPFYYGYVIKFFSSTSSWLGNIGVNPHYRVYRSFGIPIPTRYHIYGIDVSYAQGKIDWPKVKAMQEGNVYISFAFIKATEGLLTVDPYFNRNWREAAKSGIRCGAYHFFRPYKSGLWQARFFLQNVRLEKGDLPDVVDVERLDGVSPATMRIQLNDFLKQVEAQTHRKPIIYTGHSFYNDYIYGYFNSYPLWIAHYNQDELKAGKNTNWWFWQHSETARVNGISHAVDFNVFKGDSSTFNSFLAP